VTISGVGKALAGATATMSEESEEQVQEPRAPYAATDETVVEERTIEHLQVQLPPYFDRFLEERDRRIASELNRLEAAVKHNGAEIARVLREMDRRFAEAQDEQDRRFAEAQDEQDRRFAEAQDGQDRRFAEAQDGQDRRFAEAQDEQDRRFAEAQGEQDRRFAEAKGGREVLRTEIQALRAEMHSQFRWTIALLFPLVVGVIAMVIRVFFVGTF